ncbi:MAG: DUF3570 domain-containing protein [Flavobacteriales bacterium]|nr:DUF3570 domain-containing protein [Flavobacteriales bacterium]
MRIIICIATLAIVSMMLPNWLSAQEDSSSVSIYKKKVLDATTLEILGSYYTQEGVHAAVSGGRGTEALTDVHPVIVLAIPLNADDILTIDAGVSAYTSASSSNIDPFDTETPTDGFQASSGASQGDNWVNLTASYSHSSDDRNKIWSGHISVASEYDYFSAGFGGGYTRLFNQKNTEFTIKGNVLIDKWALLYPIELRPYNGGGDISNSFLGNYEITGNPDYQPLFEKIRDKGRNSYSIGIGLSQILSRKIQGSLNMDLVRQEGLLSTPFQRVYFQDIEDSFINGFHLADDIERLPGSRTKLAIGTRVNFYLNQRIVLRTQYRFYSDDWGILSHTASLTVPIKLGNRWTIYPSYRYYFQEAADYFASYNMHVSSSEFYTSDYDLSSFTANRLGFGISYTDIFRNLKLGSWGLENVSMKYHYYKRDTDFNASTISIGLKMQSLKTR